MIRKNVFNEENRNELCYIDVDLTYKLNTFCLMIYKRQIFPYTASIKVKLKREEQS